MSETKETDEQKIRRVAIEIQDVLVREKMAMIPSISLQIVQEKKKEVILTPEDLHVERPEGPDVLMDADFMKP